MKHYGDITKLNGYSLPPVDCITGGSPCQDLSVAGKRAGLAGERSGLFMEQIRIIKEMRERDRQSDGYFRFYPRPRYMVWENVPGAFSSNGGGDFQAVLTEIVRIIEPDAPDVPMPEKGKWSKSGCLYDELGRWSIAWRLHDAQFWGVPQRRKRIALVADFGGLSAPEVLFERKGMFRDSEESRTERQGTSPGTEGGAYRSISFQERAGKPGGGKGILIQNERTGALSTLNNQSVLTVHNGEIVASPTNRAEEHGHQPVIMGEPIPINTMVGTRTTEESRTTFGVGDPGDPEYTISAAHCHAVFTMNPRPQSMCTSENLAAMLGADDYKEPQMVYDARGNGNGNTVPTLTGDHQNRVTDYTAICLKRADSGVQAVTGNGYAKNGTKEAMNGMYVMQGFGDYKDSEQASACKARDYKDATDLVVGTFQNTGHGWWNESGTAASIRCASGGREANIVAAVDCRNGTENPEVNGTLQAKPNGGQSLNYQNVCRQQNTVRRLTPLECTRLQGYPDGWVDIGDWTDEKGKTHKENDSAKYKALGNSIALPFWFYLLRRISAQYERPATLGSLFDGIGGFPLCWERCNGKGSAIWASEIEEFPIAVTKRHFPE